MRIRFWRHRQPCLFDFGQVVTRFADDLELLASHIREHGHIVDSRRTADQAEIAAAMLRYANDFEGPPMCPWDTATDEEKSEWARDYTEKEDRAWADAWAFIGENIRRWWD